MDQNNIFFKYQLTVRWPGPCRNRALDVLQERPDLVDQMNNFRMKLDKVARLIFRKKYRIDLNHNLQGVNLWLESGQDVYDFIIRQPEFNWEIVPEINLVNRLTGELTKWKLVYTPSGVSID